jgi:hypothetical protein
VRWFLVKEDHSFGRRAYLADRLGGWTLNPHRAERFRDRAEASEVAMQLRDGWQPLRIILRDGSPIPSRDIKSFAKISREEGVDGFIRVAVTHPHDPSADFLLTPDETRALGVALVEAAGTTTSSPAVAPRGRRGFPVLVDELPHVRRLRAWMRGKDVEGNPEQALRQANEAGDPEAAAIIRLWHIAKSPRLGPQTRALLIACEARSIAWLSMSPAELRDELNRHTGLAITETTDSEEASAQWLRALTSQ